MLCISLCVKRTPRKNTLSKGVVIRENLEEETRVVGWQSDKKSAEFNNRVGDDTNLEIDDKKYSTATLTSPNHWISSQSTFRHHLISISYLLIR